MTPETRARYVQQEECNRERKEWKHATWGERRLIKEHDKAEKEAEEQHQKQRKGQSELTLNLFPPKVVGALSHPFPGYMRQAWTLSGACVCTCAATSAGEFECLAAFFPKLSFPSLTLSPQPLLLSIAQYGALPSHAQC
jgi:hypothetical protein